MKSQVTVLLSYKFNFLRSIFNEQCVTCNSKVKCDFCHIVPTSISIIARGRGSGHRYRDIIEHPDCYSYMCKTCHRKFDIEKLEVTKEWIKYTMDSISIAALAKERNIMLPLIKRKLLECQVKN